MSACLSPRTGLLGGDPRAVRHAGFRGAGRRRGSARVYAHAPRPQVTRNWLSSARKHLVHTDKRYIQGLVEEDRNLGFLSWYVVSAPVVCLYAHLFAGVVGNRAMPCRLLHKRGVFAMSVRLGMSFRAIGVCLCVRWASFVHGTARCTGDG